MRQWLWLKLMMFCYRRLTPGQEPMGIPGRRDPQALCEDYRPHPAAAVAWGGDCMGDGHYLCRKCSVWDKENTEMMP